MSKRRRKYYERCNGCAWSRDFEFPEFLCLQKESKFCACIVDKDHWCECHELWTKVPFEHRMTGWTKEQCIEFVKQYLEEKKKRETKGQGAI